MINRDVIMQNAAVAQGNGTAADVKGLSHLSMQVVGTFSGTITFEATVDAANWASVQVHNIATGAVSTTATAAGIYTCGVAGLYQVRARVSTWVSGSITVTGLVVNMPANPYATLPLAANSGVDIGDVTLNAGTAIAGKVYLTDGTEDVAVNADNRAEVASHLYGYEGSNWQAARLDASTWTLQIIDYAHHEIHSGSHYYLEGHATLGDGGILRVKLVTPSTAKWGHFLWDIGSSGILTTAFYEGSSGGMADGDRAVIHANNRNINCWSGFHTGGDDEATVLTDSTQSWTVDALIGMQVFNQNDKSSAFITDNDATTVTVAALAGGTNNDWDTNDVYEINNSQFVITSAVTVATTTGLLLSPSSWGDRKTGGGGQARIDELVLRQNTTYYRTFLSGAGSNIVSFKANWYEHTNKS